MSLDKGVGWAQRPRDVRSVGRLDVARGRIRLTAVSSATARPSGAACRGWRSG